jgi:hypothetical protein
MEFACRRVISVDHFAAQGRCRIGRSALLLGTSQQLPNFRSFRAETYENLTSAPLDYMAQPLLLLLAVGSGHDRSRRDA